MYHLNFIVLINYAIFYNYYYAYYAYFYNLLIQTQNHTWSSIIIFQIQKCCSLEFVGVLADFFATALGKHIK